MSTTPTPDRATGLRLDQYERLGHDMAAWITDNGLNVALAACAGALIVVLLSGLRSLGLRLCRNDRQGTGWPGIIGRVIGQTRMWFMVMLAAELVAESTAPPPGLAHAISVLVTIAVALQGALWARELVLGAIDHRAGNEPDQATLGSAMGLIRVLVTVALFAIALVLILDNVGVNVTGLVAGLGIGGIAIGLAAQGIFSDLFAALSIIFDKPFRLGDLIRWDQNVGTVEQIGLKTTRIRAVTGEQLIVSNANLLQKELRNLSNVDHQRATLTFGIVYQTPPETCAAIPGLVEEIAKAANGCAFVRCGMTGFGASSLDFELIFDIATNDPGEAATIKGLVAIEMLKAFNARGIVFAYPTQTTYTAAPDGSLVMPWAPPPAPPAAARAARTKG